MSTTFLGIMALAWYGLSFWDYAVGDNRDVPMIMGTVFFVSFLLSQKLDKLREKK